MNAPMMFVGFAIGALIGVLAGLHYGEDNGRKFTADACRNAGAFHYKQTGFTCAKVERDGKVE